MSGLILLKLAASWWKVAICNTTICDPKVRSKYMMMSRLTFEFRYNRAREVSSFCNRLLGSHCCLLTCILLTIRVST